MRKRVSEEHKKESTNRAQRAYYKRNREKVLLKNARYREENKEIVYAKAIVHNNNRRAAKLKRTPSWANMSYIKLFYKLAKLEAKRTGRKVEVDHIIPLQGKLVSGLNCEDNMQLLFKEDNCSKGNRYSF